ncbi:MFS transporter [Halobacillus shinanisalinarum]|uniref:MFS transporter n=1 Tax=Halobacillus shinanisalinarum TaxID=2932258 RepID=A0ABY4GUH4_9BACI|nr:MFS transporter [Halobacillus shinanisalinarum]UOQ91674.1 MFS transporter [Halobacillus shinanisalinarum]
MSRTNTYKLLAGYFLYECGRAMYFVLVTWFLFQWTEDALFTGLFVSIGFVPGLFSNLIFGVLVDQHNRKRLANISGAVSVVILTVLLFSFVYSWINPWWIIGTHMILQTTGSLFRPSLQALVAEVFDQKELPRVFSLSGSATISGSLSGAALGGIFSSVFPMPLSLSIVLVFYLGAFISILIMHYIPSSQLQNLKKQRFFTEMIDGFVYLKSHKMLHGLFMMMMLGQLTFHTTLGFLSVYTSAYLNHSAMVYGFLDVTFSIGGITAGLLGAWWWMRMKNKLAIWSLATVGLGLFLLGMTQNVFTAFIGVLFVGLGTSFIRALLQSVQQIATDQEYHGRMSSFRMLCNQTSVVITGPLFGMMASSFGANSVFLALLIPVSLGFIWSIHQSRQPLFVEITKQKTA